MKHFCILLLSTIMLVACNNKLEVIKLTPEIVQSIETTSQQEMLFGHYENVNTVYGGSYKGCCVFDKNRLALANFAVAVYEKKTGQKFTDVNMLIGSSSTAILVYLVPLHESQPPTQKSYLIEIDKQTAEVTAFRELIE